MLGYSVFAGRSERVARHFILSSMFVGLSVVAAACVVTPHYASVSHSESRSHNETEIERFNQSIALMAGQSAAEGDYRIGSEDLLEVTLFDIEDKQGEPRLIPARVSNTGFVTLPYVGKVKAEGLTPLELEEALRRDFKRFIHEPQITVFVREYRSYRISVVGYVKNAGVLELRGRKTLLEALAMAGGLNAEAGRGVRITRQSGAQVQTVLIDLERLARDGDMELNLILLPGDVINVPRAGIFYVEGMVKKPGAYPLLQETTVSQALATAGGPDVALANQGGITLYRKLGDGQREAIRVDVDAIRSGKSEDFVVEEDDVIYVPVSGPKYFIDRVTGRLGLGFSVPM